MSKTMLTINISVLVIAIIILFTSLNLDSTSGVTESVISEDEEILENVQEQAIDSDSSSLEFTGHGIGGLKKHDGTFNSWTGSISVENNELTNLEGTIQTASIQTSPDGVLQHLKSPDFFNIEEFPEMTFKSTSISNGLVIGVLTFVGQEREISFPIKTSENSISSEFKFDTAEYGYDKFGVDNNVDIKFNFVY